MNKMRLNTSKQKGIVLPMALIFLLVGTLIGVSSLRSNAMSERMTRNTIQRDIAMARAETALIEAEAIVNFNATAIKNTIIGSAAAGDSCNATFIVDGTSQRGFCTPAKHPNVTTANRSIERWMITDLWSDATPQRYVENAQGSKYIIEFVGHTLDSNNDTQCVDKSQLDNFPYCTQDALQFRITALAEGDIAGETRVMLQSTYVATP